MITPNPFISVIIPAYNRAHTLQRAIDSVLSQTYQCFELIVVDDCSQDDTPLLLNRIKDPRLNSIRHAINSGAAAARNTGIKAATGKYIAFLDSDDEWLPQKLEEQIQFHKTIPETEGASATDQILKDISGNETEIRLQDKEGTLENLLIHDQLGLGSTFFADRSLVEKTGGIDISLLRYEEWDWAIKLLKFTPQIYILHKPLAIIYKEGEPQGKIVEKSTEIFLNNRLADFRQIKPAIVRQAKASKWLDVSWAYLKEKNYKKGFYFFLKGFIYYPFQHPGFFLLFFDALFGTSLSSKAVQIKQKRLKA